MKINYGWNKGCGIFLCVKIRFKCLYIKMEILVIVIRRFVVVYIFCGVKLNKEMKWVLNVYKWFKINFLCKYLFICRLEIME